MIIELWVDILLVFFRQFKEVILLSLGLRIFRQDVLTVIFIFVSISVYNVSFFFGYPQDFTFILSLVLIILNTICLNLVRSFVYLYVYLFVYLYIFCIYLVWCSLRYSVSSFSGVLIVHVLSHLMLVPVLRCPVLVFTPHFILHTHSFVCVCFNLDNFCLLT